jgi:hypothetical protein
MRSGALLALALVACGSPEPAETPTAPETPAPTPPAAETPPAASPVAEAPAAEEPATVEAAPAIPEAICERARACCRAYVEAIPSARRPLEERGCTEMDEVLVEAGSAADEACEAAIGGWRQSLQLTGLEVPAACAEP